jgi:hypothetical protein
MRPTKYTYLKVIQQNYGTWEDVSEYETNSKGEPKEYLSKLNHIGCKVSLLKHDLREYKLMGYATRVIQRKQLNTL